MKDIKFMRNALRLVVTTHFNDAAREFNGFPSMKNWEDLITSGFALQAIASQYADEYAENLYDRGVSEWIPYLASQHQSRS